jgi:hypothetical protein
VTEVLATGTTVATHAWIAVGPAVNFPAHRPAVDAVVEQLEPSEVPQVHEVHAGALTITLATPVAAFCKYHDAV